jgi:hypothetical protein
MPSSALAASARPSRSGSGAVIASVHFTSRMSSIPAGQPIVTRPAPAGRALGRERRGAGLAFGAGHEECVTEGSLVARGRTRRELRRRARAGPEEGSGLGVGRAVRDADARHEHLPGPLARRLEREPQLGQGERDGDVCGRRDPAHAAGVCAKARGQVDRHHPGPALPRRDEPPDARRLRPLHVAVESGAEDGVDQHAAHRCVPAVPQGLHADRARALPLARRVSAQARGLRADQRHPHGHAQQAQVARGDHAVAAIVARAADGQHRRALAQAQHRLRHGAARALHEHLPRYAQRLDRVAVQRTHLRRGEEGPGRAGHSRRALRSRKA